MDEELADLERRVSADPSDAELGLQYERALRRAGDQERLRSLYAFQFECPMQWHQLERTPDPLVRHCEGCAETVHFARDPGEFATLTAAGRCVAVADHDLAERLEAAAAASGRAPQDAPRSGCVVGGTWYDLLLDHAESLGPMTLGQGAGLLVPTMPDLVAASGAKSLSEAYQSAWALRRDREREERPARVLPLARRVLGWLRGE